MRIVYSNRDLGALSADLAVCFAYEGDKVPRGVSAEKLRKDLAAEMKAYAKTLPGSVYVVDRRGLTVARPENAPQNRAMDMKDEQVSPGWPPATRP